MDKRETKKRKKKKTYDKTDTEIILEHRPVRVFVGGEVEKPGLITIPGSFVLSDQPFNNNKPFSNDYFFPSVYDAIRKAGSKLLFLSSNIEVIRINNSSNGGGQIKNRIGFYGVLSNNLLTYNHDGDYINIKQVNLQFLIK